MRIALIADIHANVHALRAVLESVGTQDVSGTYHLGDLVGYAAHPNQTVELLLDSEIAGVSGNYDSTVATNHEHCGCRYEDPHQAELSHQSFEWTLAHTRKSTREALGQLPFRIDLRPEGGHKSGRSVVLVHGTPTSNTLYWHEDRSDDFCRTMGEQAGLSPGDVIAFGHTHVPWVREVDGIWYVNAGSVGRPKDGDWRACYAVLDLTDDEPSVEFVRTEYDIDAACTAIQDSSLPDFFAEYLRAGGSPAPDPGNS